MYLGAVISTGVREEGLVRSSNTAALVRIDDMVAAKLHVNGPRLLSELERLADYGRDPGGGISRLGLCPADIRARRHLAGRAAEAGLASRVDEAGNLFIHRPGAGAARGPVLLMGSHLDSVPHGGKLDGAYGVLAAIEALRVLLGSGLDFRYEPVVVAFTNEEGALFPQPFWGSKALAGQLSDPESAEDRTGNSIREALAAAGGDLDRIQAARWRPGSIAAFLELHIEQGPVLEAAAVPIGVVTGIVGRTILDIELRGCQNHAGTTPMDQRTDALVAAAQVVLAVEELSRDRRLCAVSTVGVLQVHPGQTNVVPGRVSLTAELRDADRGRLRRAESALLAEINRLTGRAGISADVRTTMRSEPVHTAPFLQQIVETAADRLALPWLRMPSGAGHDAQIVASLAPVGMIFVPSRAGVSHAPKEHTEPQQLIAGADTLLQAALLVQQGPIPDHHSQN
jgi:N-carbamoyl-L-amino-acid hydrolase